MIGKFLQILLLTSFSLSAAPALHQENEFNAGEYESHAGNRSLSHKHHRHDGKSYAVLSNQVAVSSGNQIPWSPVVGTSHDIFVDALGNITLPKGLFLVQYTVRINKTPYAGTTTATVQLQQTVLGVPTNINQPAITENISVDLVTENAPVSQTQITGYAFIKVTSASNNVLDLFVTLDNASLTIPAASGVDANAQIAIIQIQ